jgi:NTP pyrophosphatase (non-canonical NTP hydrolase)
MELKNIINRAVEIRTKYSELEKQKYGREWTPAEIAQGFVGDVGDLSKLILAKSGVRDIEKADEKLAHELSDCLWSILVLANKYDVDIEDAFMKTMDDLEKRISNEVG